MLYPVPAVMVSCQRPGERPNIITVAWAGTVCSDPAMVSISIRKERYSYDIIKETGSFVINLVSRDLTAAMDTCGVRSGRDMDKFQELHLTPQQSQHVEAPGVAECPVNLECRVSQVVPLGTHDMFLAEVVGVSVDRQYMDEKGTFHLNDAGLVAYSHGTYFELGEKIGTFGYSVRKKPEKESKGSPEKKAGKKPEKQPKGKPEKRAGKKPEKQPKGKPEKRAGKTREKRQDEIKYNTDRNACIGQEHHRRTAGKAAGLFFCRCGYCNSGRNGKTAEGNY